MFHSIARLPALLLALLLLPACPHGLRTTQTPEAALLYGYFKMPEGKALTQVMLAQDERVGIAVRNGHIKRTNEGLFWIEDLPPMRYAIGYFRVNMVLHTREVDESRLVELRPGSLHFLGSFDYQPLEDPGFITRRGAYSLEPTLRPSEAEVLQKLLPLVEREHWRRKIEARLRELRPR